MELKNARKHKLMFVFGDKNFIIETDDVEDIANQDWFREFLGLDAVLQQRSEEMSAEELEEEMSSDEELEDDIKEELVEKELERMGQEPEQERRKINVEDIPLPPPEMDAQPRPMPEFAQQPPQQPPQDSQQQPGQNQY